MAEPDAADFLRICRLPGAWARQPAWRLLDTCFGNAGRFLGVWEAWQQDPDRPALLHYVGLSQQALLPELLLGAAHQTPGRRALASALAKQCQGLGPGFHRISLHHGQLLLTLCVGELQPLLRQQRFEADAIFLDPGPAGLVEGAPWNLFGIKALARLADPAGATLLAIKLQSPGVEKPEVLTECMQSLILLEDERAHEALIPYLDHADEPMAAYAALTLSRTRRTEAAEAIANRVERFRGEMLDTVLLALARCGVEEAREAVERFAGIGKPGVKEAARRTMETMGWEMGGAREGSWLGS